MCIVCIDWEKGKLTKREALQNLAEMEIDLDDEEEYVHIGEIIEKVIKSKNP